jgi:TolA-binding protein
MIVIVALLLSVDYEQLVTDYEIGHQLFLQEDYVEAANYFKSMLGRYSGSQFEDEIRFRLAECYFNLSDFRDAKKQFETIVRKERLSYLEPECLYAIGLIDILQNNYSEAEEILQSLLKNPAYQQEDRANFALGVLHYFRGSYEEAREKLAGLELLEAKFYYGKSLSRLGYPLQAIAVFKEILDVAPNTPIAVLAEFSRAEALFFNQDYDGSRIKFHDFILNYPLSSLNDYAHYFLAASLVHAGDYAAASEHLLPLTRHSDNLLAAHSSYFLGICRMNLGDGMGAVSSFQRVRANFPNTQIASYANLQLTNALLAAGDTAQALVSASQLATMFATGELSSVGEYLTGMIYFQKGDYYHAANSFDLISQHYPNSSLREPGAAMHLYSLNNLKQYDHAVTFGSRYIRDFTGEKSPWRGRTLYFLGEAYYNKGNYPEAEKHFLTVTKSYFGLEITPYARIGLAYSMFNQDRPKEAYQILNGLKQTPFDDSSLVIAVYLGIGYTQYNLGNYMAALDTFEVVYNTYEKDERCVIPSLFYAGMCYYNLEYYGQAIEAWETLIGMYPFAQKSAEAAFRAGDTYFKALEYDKARALFRWCVENHPSNDYARSGQLAIGQSYYNEQNFDEAIREFQKFLDLFPTSDEAASARKSMEMCYYRKGLESIDEMQFFVNKFPQSELAADGQYQIAEKFYEEKNYSQAVDEFLKVVVNFPTSSYAPDALLFAAESANEMENWDKAADIYQRYLTYFPDGKQKDAVYFNLGTAHYNLKEYGDALTYFRVVVDSFPQSANSANARHNIEICEQLLGEGSAGTVPVTEEAPADSVMGEESP